MFLSSAITFPNLGISVDPSPVAFSLFGRDIYWYGVIIGLGFLLAFIYADRRVKQFGLTEDQLINMLICAVPVAVICARIYYCVFFWSEFRDNPISCLYIWNGGLAIYGAVIGAVAAVAIYCRAAKVRLGAMLDIGGLGLLIGQTAGRWGNFMNREAFGAVTDSFFKMGLADAAGVVTYYHPTFLYESVWNLVGFALLHFYSKKRRYDGEVFTLYVAWYGLGRGFIEGLRTDSLYLFGTGIRVSQLLAFVSCIAAVGVLVYERICRKHTPEQLYVNVIAARAAEKQEDTDEK